MPKNDDKPTEWTLEHGSVPTIQANTHELASASRLKVRALEELRRREHEAMGDDLQRALG
jgi:hypothetical protein